MKRKHLNICFVGASTDCGYLNLLPAGHKLTFYESFLIFFILPLTILLKIPVIFIKIQNLGFSKKNIKQVFSFEVVDFFLKYFSQHEHILHEWKLYVEKTYQKKVTLYDFSIPTQGFFNLYVNKTLERLQDLNVEFDLIVLHLGGNDLIQVVSDDEFIENVNKVKEVIKNKFPHSIVIVYNIINMNKLLNEKIGKEHSLNFFGFNFNMGQVRSIYNLLAPIKKEALKRKMHYSQVFHAERMRKNEILKREFSKLDNKVLFLNQAKFRLKAKMLNVDGLHISNQGLTYLGKKNISILDSYLKEFIND